MTQSDDKEKLVEFATSLYAWLDACYLGESRIKSMENGWPVVRPYAQLRTLGSRAWVELKESYPLSAFIGSIRDIPDDRLRAHGLSGAQLNYKFAVIGFVADKLGKLKFPARHRARVIDAIDTVLDSLIDATGIGTALKEIKDMLRHQITA